MVVLGGGALPEFDGVDGAGREQDGIDRAARQRPLDLLRLSYLQPCDCIRAQASDRPIQLLFPASPDTLLLS